MTPRESWHLPPGISTVLVAGLWGVLVVCVVIMIARVLSEHRAITRDPEASEQHRAVRNTLATATLWATLGSIVILLVILNGVHLRWWKGGAEEAEVISMREGRSGKTSTPTWIVTVDSERIGETTVYATEDFYRTLEPGARVPVVSVVGVGGVTQLGREPTVSAAHLFIAALLLLVPIANVLDLAWRRTVKRPE